MQITDAPPFNSALIVGIAPRIRRSFLISPLILSNGTLKSTRTSTFRPARLLMSEIVILDITISSYFFVSDVVE